MDLAELETYVVNVRAERGFTREPVRLLALLVEEVGEVARELKRTWSVNYEPFSTGRLADELADVQTLVLAPSNAFGIDLEAACLAKLGKDAQREWRSASPARPTEEPR